MSEPAAAAPAAAASASSGGSSPCMHDARVAQPVSAHAPPLVACSPSASAGSSSAPAAAEATKTTSPVVEADYGPASDLSPCASPDTDPTHRFYYIGYGSNMLPSMLLLKKVHVHSSRRVILHDVELLFDLAVKSLVEPSYANLRRHPAGSGHETHGIMYELESRDMLTMDRVEGNGRSYVREEFQAELYEEEVDTALQQLPEGVVTVRTGSDGRRHATVTASAYICHPNNLSRLVLKDTPPSRRYLDVLIAGARYHKLRPEYIAKLEVHPATPLPKLEFTAEQLRAIEARTYTEAELAAGGWRDYMANMPPEQWPDPLLIALRGIVFDVRHSPYASSWKQANGGKCMTLFTAGRVATDCVSIPTELEHLGPEHKAYVNATLVDWARSYIIMGHMEDRGKYDF